MRVLAIGAHPDDVELGCGGALLRHAARGDEVHLLVMTVGELGDGGRAVRRAEQERAVERLGAARLHWGRFPDGAVPPDRRAISLVEQVLAEVRPELVYGHGPWDTHQDHRATSAAVLSCSRRVPKVLLYETLTTTRAFSPTHYVDVSAVLEAKLDLLGCHASQVEAGRVRTAAVRARAAVRGDEAGVAAAEAFQAERYVMTL
ncbi:MAG TPA: PIG-L deacetylase family protein [Acidimicrobiales bacterium]